MAWEKAMGLPRLSTLVAELRVETTIDLLRHLERPKGRRQLYQSIYVGER